MTNFKKVEDDKMNIWLPTKKGDSIEGTIVKKQEGKFGEQCEIKVEGEEKTVFTPSHGVLQNRLAQRSVGELIKIVYVGEELPTVKGNNPTKMYDVYTSTDEVQEEKVEG